MNTYLLWQYKGDCLVVNAESINNTRAQLDQYIKDTYGKASYVTNVAITEECVVFGSGCCYFYNDLTNAVDTFNFDYKEIKLYK